MTQEIIKQYLNYDPYTGEFTWKTKHCSKVIIGAVAGSINRGHRVINFAGCLYPEHRLAWLYMTGKFPDGHIDHIDHNEFNNIFSNLRDVSQKENNMNNSLRVDNRSGEIGIYPIKRKYRVSFQVDVHVGNNRYNKSFKTLEQAIVARNKFYNDYGFHANHGLSKPT